MMGRKCSHCGHCGHNSRTCISPKSLVGCDGLKLFGVQLHIDSPMKKSFSMDCLSNATCSSSPTTSSSSSSLAAIEETAEKISTSGYLSDGLGRGAQERKKGIPWSEEEHGKFLAGLEKLGKGDWRGISRNFVTSRTPTQVASHAQKFFLRQSNIKKRKRRSSLFDSVSNSGTTTKLHEHFFSIEQDVPMLLSLGSTGVESCETNAIDLNSSQQAKEIGFDSSLDLSLEQAKEIGLDSSLDLLPTSTFSSTSQSLDLELSISLSMTTDENTQSLGLHF